MISVEQLIGELLLRHNCVIIPSFGGFVAKQTAASIDYRNGVMTPPRKSLLFNRQLINNDGLLIAELAVRNSVNYNTATDDVQGLVNSWNEQLRKGERITIDKVGFLFFDQEKNICFEQDRFFNLLLESYGLGKVHFLTESDVHLAQKTTIEIAVEASESEKKPAIVFDTEKIKIETPKEKVVIQHPALKSKGNVWRYVAAACLLPIAFYSFWLPIKTDVLESGMLSVKDFNPFYKATEGTYNRKNLEALPKEEKYKTIEESVSDLPSDVNVFSYKYDEDLYIPIRIKSNQSAAPIETIESTYTETYSNVSGKVEYIVGCFGNEANASNLVASLKQKGYNAKITDVTNGLSRISAGSANNEQELQQVIQKAKADGLEGWILKK